MGDYLRYVYLNLQYLLGVFDGEMQYVIYSKEVPMVLFATVGDEVTNQGVWNLFWVFLMEIDMLLVLQKFRKHINLVPNTILILVG